MICFLELETMPMNDSTTVEWMAKAIGKVTRSANFCVAGRLPVFNPGIEIAGLGPITFR